MEQQFEKIKEETLEELKKMHPDDVESFALDILDDTWDEIEGIQDPQIIKAHAIVDYYLSGDTDLSARAEYRISELKWNELLDALATLEAFRRIRRKSTL